MGISHNQYRLCKQIWNIPCNLSLEGVLYLAQVKKHDGHEFTHDPILERKTLSTGVDLPLVANSF